MQKEQTMKIDHIPSEIVNEIIQIMQNDLDRINQQIESYKNALLGNNTVIRTAESIYVKVLEGKPQWAGITDCSRFEPSNAARLAPLIQNGNGDKGVAVLLGVALKEEKKILEELLAEIKSKV
jgi:hypothetical protein